MKQTDQIGQRGQKLFSRYVSRASSTHITGNVQRLRWSLTARIPSDPLLQWNKEVGTWKTLRHTHTHVHTHEHTPPPCPPLSFLRFSSFVGLSLRLFRLLLRLASLPQSRAKYSLFLHLPFLLALLALLFLSFFSFVSKAF